MTRRMFGAALGAGRRGNPGVFLHWWLSGSAALCALPAAAADIPRPARAKVFPAPNGATIDTSKHKGKAVVIEFLLTTCPHCQKVAATLQRMQDEFGARGFQAFGVAINTEDPAVIEAFRQRFGVKFPVGWSKREDAHAYLQHPAMLRMNMPQVVFIDRRGMIQAQYAGDNAFFDDASQSGNFRKKIPDLMK